MNLKYTPLAALAAVAPVAILGMATQANAATLLTPGAVQVEYTLGEGGTNWAANLQNDASGNGRTMAAGGGDAPWDQSGIAPGSSKMIMVQGPAAYVMNNTTGIASNFQVSIFLSSNGQFGSGNAGGTIVFNIGDLRLEATGVPSSESMTYSASVGASSIGSITVGGWANEGLMVQKSGSTFSFWASNDTGASWTQQGSDLVAPSADINWAGTHLFIKPGGGSQYQGYADDFKVVAVVPEPGAALLGGLGMLALLRRRRA